VSELDGIDVRRRRSRAEAEQLLAECEASGLSREEFCRQKGLSLATLARYRKRRSDGNAAPDSRWLAVEVTGGSALAESDARSGLAVTVGSGHRIEITRGFDVPTWVQLLSVLERI
jgi:transcriptional regulator with XRE-family HTH domain